MTCIVGIEDETFGVVMAADSLGSTSQMKTERADVKVFHRDHYMIGFTSSFRMGQLLRYALVVPDQGSMSDHEHMVVNFAESCRSLFKAHGYGDNTDGKDNTGGCFLVAYRGRLYTVESDYQVGIPRCGYAATGCGACFALGSLYSTMGNAKERAKLAVRAAIANDPHCGGAVRVLEQLRPKKHG